MELVIRCLACGEREPESLNPQAADDMLTLARHIFDSIEHGHVPLVCALADEPEVIARMVIEG